jgi:hypothetical protein
MDPSDVFVQNGAQPGITATQLPEFGGFNPIPCLTSKTASPTTPFKFRYAAQTLKFAVLRIDDQSGMF